MMAPCRPGACDPKQAKQSKAKQSKAKQSKAKQSKALLFAPARQAPRNTSSCVQKLHNIHTDKSAAKKGTHNNKSPG
jgi:hypothetical protein